jgi:flagellar motility protein MotE (MotC chaperone)
MGGDVGVTTIITRVAQSGVLQRVIPPLIAAVLGAMGGSASYKVTDAAESATVQENRAEVLALKSALEDARSGFRQYADKAVKEEETEREQDVKELREKVARLEALLERER